MFCALYMMWSQTQDDSLKNLLAATIFLKATVLKLQVNDFLDLFLTCP